LNARNDARDVASALTSFGYSVVLALDVNRDQLEQDLNLFAQSLSPGDAALVYYSGHGFQAEGENYLVPIDFTANTEAIGRQQGFSLSTLLQAIISRGSTVQIVILDACRDNPFFSSRSAKAGWADVGTATGTLIAFGTSPGSTSSDNPTGRNGLFTKQVLSYISSDLPVESLFKRVSKETIIASQGAQTPWIASSLVGDFYINGRSANSLKGPTTPSLDEQIAGSAPTLDTQSGRNLGSSKSYSGTVTDLRSADILVNQGLLLAQQGDYEEAIRSLSASLVAHPSYSIALRVLGLILHLLGRGADAAAQFSRAINADPSDALAYTYRCAEMTNIDPTAAIRDCYAAIALTPQSLPAHLLLSNALIAAGRTATALREVNLTLTLAPDSARAYSLRARLNREIGKNDAADMDIKRAVGLSMIGKP
jgi:Flp pilus assembly protein TadD